MKNNINLISIIALVIALVGGIPGIIGIIDYYQRNAIRIIYEQQNSVSCSINSSTGLNNRPALLLHNITISGKGHKPTYLRSIGLELKVNNSWVKGTHFIPSKKKQVDDKDNIRRFIHLRLSNQTSNEDLYLAYWVEFIPGQKGLRFGEPITFSYATFFEIDTNTFQKCKKAKIRVTDYIGHDYEEIISIDSLMVNYSNISLMLND